MCIVSNHWATIRRIVMAITFLHGFVASLSAQTEKSALKNPTQKKETRPEKAPQGSQNSFKLPRSQSVIQCFDVIRQAIDRKDYLSALPLLERILSEPDSFVPAPNSNEVAAHEEVYRLLESMPADLRERFNESRRSQSLQDWDQARRGGIDDIQHFLKHFSDMPLAAQAWWWIGCYERDHGRWSRAASAFHHSASHAKATLQQRAFGLIAAIEELTESNRLEEARRLRQELSKIDGNLALNIGGDPVILGQVSAKLLERILASPNQPVPPASADWRRLRPASLPIWKQEINTPLRANLEGLELSQRDQGIRPVPIVRPMIVGRTVIARTLNEIKAYDLSDGTALWSIPNTDFRQIEKRAFENASFQTIATEWAQRRSQADSIFARMSTDGQQLFVIQEPDRNRELRVEREAPQQNRRMGPRYNQLISYSVGDGSQKWDATSANVETLKGTVYLGCPYVLDDQLFVMAQKEVELSLLALDTETGLIRSSIKLGTASLPVEIDLLRSRVACPIVWSEGLLICSTSSGTVVAVDPILQCVKWGYCYPATTISTGDLGNGPVRQANLFVQEKWWESWREPFAKVVVGPDTGSEPAESPSNEAIRYYVFASPESGDLHAIRLPDGEPIWRVPRESGLLVVEVVDNQVIVLEGDAVRSHDLQTGQLRWRTSIGEVSGPAVVAGTTIFVPMFAGGTTILNLRDGKLLLEASSNGSPMGVLAETAQGWIDFDRSGITSLPRLWDIRIQAERDLKMDPNSEALRVHAALLDLQAGDSESARARLTGLTSSPARDLRSQALIAALLQSPADTSGTLRTDLTRELNELADNAEHRFAAAAAIGTSALAVDDLIATVDAALTGLSADLYHYDSLIKRASVMVRKDRILLGLMEEAYRRATPEVHGQLNNLISDRVKLVKKNRDRLALQRLADLSQGSEWGRRLVMTEEERTFQKRSLTRIELRLLDAAGSSDPELGRQALEKLIQRFERLGMEKDAFAVRRRIPHEFPSVKSQQTTSPAPDRDPNPQEPGSNVLKPLFPEVTPEVEPSRKDRNFGVYCPLIPMQAEPDSLASRLDVAIDRTGSDVVFRGESFFQAGQDEEHERKFPIPKTMSPLRGPAGHMLRQAWGIGRIVIVLVGSELFAISPLDDQGEPNSRFLWSNPIDLQLPLTSTTIRPDREGIFIQQHIVLDDSAQVIGKVGPVRASYLCYQTGNRLVAVETYTGQELWRRNDCPTTVTVLGDDQYVYLWHESDSIEVLSAIDGRRLHDREWFASPDTMIQQRGSLVWTATRGEKLVIELHDLKTGRRIWSQTYSHDALVAVLDQETLAVVTPDDKLHLLDARTAAAIGPDLPVNSQDMTEIAAWQDSEQWYIGLSRHISNQGTLKSLQPMEGYRLRFLNGPLYAVTREKPHIAWQRNFKNEPLALDQSRVSPVLIQLWKLAPEGKLDASKGSLCVIDKRTGKNLVSKSAVEILPYFLLNPDPQQGMLELKLTQETIRLNYDKN